MNLFYTAWKIEIISPWSWLYTESAYEIIRDSEWLWNIQFIYVFPFNTQPCTTLKSDYIEWVLVGWRMVCKRVNIFKSLLSKTNVTLNIFNVFQKVNCAKYEQTLNNFKVFQLRLQTKDNKILEEYFCLKIIFLANFDIYNNFKEISCPFYDENCRVFKHLVLVLMLFLSHGDFQILLPTQSCIIWKVVELNVSPGKSLLSPFLVW